MSSVTSKRFSQQYQILLQDNFANRARHFEPKRLSDLPNCNGTVNYIIAKIIQIDFLHAVLRVYLRVTVHIMKCRGFLWFSLYFSVFRFSMLYLINTS